MRMRKPFRSLHDEGDLPPGHPAVEMEGKSTVPDPIWDRKYAVLIAITSPIEGLDVDG